MNVLTRRKGSDPEKGRLIGRRLTWSLLLVGAVASWGCSSGLGNNIDLEEQKGLVTETGLGLDLGFELTDPISADMAVAGAEIPGSDRRITFVAFSTAARADNADGAGGALSMDAVTDTNGEADIFVVAIEDHLGSGGQPVAFSRALVNTFRHSRCVHCHAIGSVPAPDEPFVFPGNGHPGGQQPVLDDECSSCHIAANIGMEVEWRAPRANNGQGFDMRSETLEELAVRAQKVDFEEHLLNDSRVTWAIESGVVPFGQLAGSSQTWEAEGYGDVDVGPVPISFDAFENQLLDWRAAGFPVTAQESVLDVTLVSVRHDGPSAANGASTEPSMTFVPDPTFDSANPSAVRFGRLVIAYTSTASDLIETGNGTPDVYTTALDVFVDRDPVNSTTQQGGLDIVHPGNSTFQVSHSTQGGPSNGASSSPSIDGSGDLVAFASVASNLVGGFSDQNGAGMDVYLWDRASAQSALVSAAASSSTQGGNGDSDEPVLSATGEAVAFSSLATDLTLEDDLNGVRDVFYTQRDVGGFAEVVRASSPGPGLEANAASGAPAISATNAGVITVAFESAASNMGGVEPGTTNVFLHEAGSVTLMSQKLSAGSGTPGNGNSSAPQLTPNGGVLCFTTEATNLDVLQASDENSAEDVLIVDLAGFRRNKEVLGRRVSLNWAGLDASAGSSGAFVGNFREIDGFFGDGTFVTFRSTAEDLGVTRQDVVTKFLVDTTSDVTDFSADSTGGGVPLTVRFTDISTGNPSAWSWDFGDGFSSTEQNPAHTYSDAGSYSVALTVTREGETDTRVKTDFISALEPIGVTDCGESITSGPAPLQVTFTPTLTGDTIGVTYLWHFGDDSTSTEPQPTHSYAEGGPYTVRLDVSALSGSASFEDPDRITALPPSGANFSSDTTGGLRVVFQDTSSGNPDSWHWDFGDDNTSTDQNPTHDYGANGDWEVTLTVDGPGGPSSFSQTVTTDATSFSGEIYNLFEDNNCTACHQTGGSAGSLNFRSSASQVYDKLVNVASSLCVGEIRVVPFDTSDASVLVQIADVAITPCTGIVMANFLEPGLSTLREWIAEGAAR